MEFRELKTFQVVANLMSFNKAASVLNYAQSTVSQQIQSLENSLGVMLFVRLGNKIKLTDSGVKLLNHTQRLKNIENEILSEFKCLNETAGNLIIKTPHSVIAYLLPPVIKEFQIKYPNIGFDFDGCIGYNVIDVFNAGLIDIAFLISNKFIDKHLQVEELVDIELVFVTNPQETEFNDVINSINEFSDKTLFLSKSDCSYRMIFEKMLIESDVRLKKTIEVNSPDAAKRMLAEGCKGVALLPKLSVKHDVDEGLLKVLKWNGPAFDVKLYMIWSKEKFQTEAVKAFVKTVCIFFDNN
jgi:DNA-binding transcriptional LysR family regulator